MDELGVPRTAVVGYPRRASAPQRKRRWTPVSALEFVGCDSCRMTLAEYEEYPEDGRKIEFFDSEVGLAWMMREGPTFPHEEPGRMLVGLVREIAMTRGAPIKCSGAASLRLLDADFQQVRAIHPDEMVFLHPERADPANPSFLAVGEDAYPEVVLEVDHTRDTRRDKLKLYEEWGFPELWVEVPDAYSASRPRGLKPELRIYLLEGERYVLSEESRAFPGWRAEEIHRALNEAVISTDTSAVLERVGRALGEREGTGPGATTRCSGRTAAEDTSRVGPRAVPKAVPKDAPPESPRRRERSCASAGWRFPRRFHRTCPRRTGRHCAAPHPRR